MSKLDEMFTCTELGEEFKPIKKSNDMSKNRIPEAGDIFKDEYGEKAHILWVGYVVVYVRKYWITSYEYHYEVGKLDYDKFIRKWTYLGKSKANIEQLFELENNGRCVEDNTPHVKSMNYNVTIYGTQMKMYNYRISISEENYIETLKKALSKNEIIELPLSDGRTILFNTKNIAMVEIVKTLENEE